MNQSPARPALTPTDASFLRQVEERLVHVLQAELPDSASPDGVLGDAVRDLVLGGGGKRARPLLVASFGAMVGVAPPALLDVAVAAELIHSASLLHDDVVDEAATRRGRPTARARWGGTASVLAGDVLLSAALTRLQAYPRAVTSSAIAVVSNMSRAAWLEIGARGQVSLPMERWKTIAAGKTGALFGWCGQAAALIADDAGAAERFRRAGQGLGISFQLADDLADLAPARGKDRFSDIRNRNPSHPVMLAVAQAPSLQRRFEAAWRSAPVEKETVEALARAVLESGAVAASHAELQRQVSAALEALEDGAPPQPSGLGIRAWATSLITPLGAWIEAGAPSSAAAGGAEP